MKLDYKQELIKEIQRRNNTVATTTLQCMSEYELKMELDKLILLGHTRRV